MLPPEGETIAVFTPITSPARLKVGSAGVAAVHRRVDLQEVVVGAGADIAAAGGHDAGGDGAAEAERIADREHPVTDARYGGGELHPREIATAALDLEERHVGARIAADHLGGVGPAVVGGDVDLGRALDHVVVGDDVAVGGDEEARALAGRAPIARTLAHAGLVAEEAAHELLDLRRQALAARATLVIFEETDLRGVDLDLDADHRGTNLLDDVGE